MGNALLLMAQLALSVSLVASLNVVLLGKSLLRNEQDFFKRRRIEESNVMFTVLIILALALIPLCEMLKI